MGESVTCFCCFMLTRIFVVSGSGRLGNLIGELISRTKTPGEGGAPSSRDMKPLKKSESATDQIVEKVKNTSYPFRIKSAIDFNVVYFVIRYLVLVNILDPHSLLYLLDRLGVHIYLVYRCCLLSSVLRYFARDMLFSLINNICVFRRLS